MAEHDPLTDLSELARVGEDYADPIPVEQVRRRAQRRRTRRRAGLVSAVVVAVVVAGGAVVSTTGLRADRVPEPVGTPSSAVPAPTSSTPSTSPSEDSPVDPPAARGLRLANLPTESDLEWQDQELEDHRHLLRYRRAGHQPLLAPGPRPCRPSAATSGWRQRGRPGGRSGDGVRRRRRRGDRVRALTPRATTARDSDGSGLRAVGVGNWLPVKLPAGRPLSDQHRGSRRPHVDDTHSGLRGRPGGNRWPWWPWTPSGWTATGLRRERPDGAGDAPMFRTLPKVAARLSGRRRRPRRPHHAVDRAISSPVTRCRSATPCWSRLPRRPGGGRGVRLLPPGEWDSLGSRRCSPGTSGYDCPRSHGPHGEPGTPGYTPCSRCRSSTTTALQFGDEAAAVRAQARYRDWLSGCAKDWRSELHLTNRDRTKTTWIDVPAAASGGRVVGKCAVLRPTSCRASRRDRRVRGSVLRAGGLAQSATGDDHGQLAWGTDYHYSDQPGGDQTQASRPIPSSPWSRRRPSAR